MIEYHYEAKTPNGQIVTGTISAINQKTAARLLAAEGLQILSLKANKKSHILPQLNLQTILARKSFPQLFCRQLATLLNAGLTVSDSLKILTFQTSNHFHQKILSAISSAVDSGIPLSTALAQFPDIFSPTVIALTSAGELSGNLDIIFNRLSKHLETSVAAREKFITIMMYPLILVFSALLSAFLVIIYILPTFSIMFQSFHIPLPLPTKILLSIGSFFQQHYPIIIGSIPLLIGILFLVLRRSHFEATFDRIKSSLPVIGQIFIDNELLKFSSTLSILLRSGIVIDKAVAHMITIAQSPRLRQKLAKCHAGLLKGYSLANLLRQEQAFPPMYLELLAAGETTGEIDTMLDKIADICQQDLNTTCDRLQIIAEPISIIAIASFIMPLVLAIILPILDTITLFS